MGSERKTGPRTRAIAAELREKRDAQGWTLDDIVERTHLARTTVHRALTGESALPVEVLIPLAMGMGVDLRTLMDLAAAHGDEGDIDPTSR